MPGPTARLSSSGCPSLPLNSTGLWQIASQPFRICYHLSIGVTCLPLTTQLISRAEGPELMISSPPSSGGMAQSGSLCLRNTGLPLSVLNLLSLSILSLSNLPTLSPLPYPHLYLTLRLSVLLSYPSLVLCAMYTGSSRTANCLRHIAQLEYSPARKSRKPNLPFTDSRNCRPFRTRSMLHAPSHHCRKVIHSATFIYMSLPQDI